jgi:hypothetical protein
VDDATAFQLLQQQSSDDADEHEETLYMNVPLKRRSSSLPDLANLDLDKFLLGDDDYLDLTVDSDDDNNDDNDVGVGTSAVLVPVSAALVPVPRPRVVPAPRAFPSAAVHRTHQQPGVRRSSSYSVVSNQSVFPIPAPRPTPAARPTPAPRTTRQAQPKPTVRCSFSDRNLHSRMPLDPTHVRLKRTRV